MMKNLNFLTKASFRLLALILCLAASIPQMRADTWTVAGTSNAFLQNQDWKQAYEGNDMTQSGSYYYLARTANVNSGDYAFKVVKNHNWDVSYPASNYDYSVSSTDTWSIVYIFNSSNNNVSLFGPFKSLTIVGETDLVGANWDFNNTACDMTTTNGIDYTLTQSNVQLQARYYEYKLCQDRGWTKTWPQEGNYGLNINDAGIYDVTYSFNVLTQTLSAVATQLVDYYVVGDETLMGIDWDATISDDALMSGSNGTYTWSKQGIHLNMGTYNLKVKGSDGNWYGDSNNNNVSVTADESGTYTLEVTFSNGVVTATLTRTATDASQAYNIYVRYTGNESPENVYMHAWNAVTEYDQMPGVKFSTMTTEMINGYLYYKYTINTTASSIGLLFNENGSDQTKTGDLSAQPGNNYFTYGGGSTVSGPTATPDAVANYYITGSDGLGLGWKCEQMQEMTMDSATGYYSYTYNVTESGTYNFVFSNGEDNSWEAFNANHRIGPTGNTDVSITPNGDWNGTQMANGGNKAYSVKLNPGTVTITFDPATMRFKVDGVYLTHNYTFYVLPSDHSTNPYIFLWGLGTDESFHNDYPGTQLTVTEVLDDGNTWYKLSVDLTAEYIHALVNGGGTTQNADNTKTADITHIDPGTYYIYWTTIREDGKDHNDYLLTNVPPTNPGGTLHMIGTYYYGKQYNYRPDDGAKLKYDANTQTYYLNNVNLAVNNTFCFTTQLSSGLNDWNVGTRYGNAGNGEDPGYTLSGNTTNYFEINENYINKKLNLDEWSDTYGEFRITVPGIYNVLVNPTQKWVQLIKTDYYELTPMNVFLEQTPNVTMPADFLQNPGTEYTNTLFNGGNWPLAAFNGSYGDGQWNPQDNGNHYPVTFVGDTTTVDGKKWWHWQVEASIAEIFFTRTNEPCQSDTIRRKAGVLWVTWDEVDGEATLTDHSREYFEAAANALPTNAVVMEGHYYVYFINTVNWDKVYCYAWDNDTVRDDQGNIVLDQYGKPQINNFFQDGYSRQMNSWPGQPCELVGIDPVTGYEVWRYDFGTIIGTDIPNGGIIFNDGNQYAETEAKEQTGDFEYVNGAVYDYLGMVDGAYTLNNLIRTAAKEVRYTVSNDLLGVFWDPNAKTPIKYTDKYGQETTEVITGALYAKDLNLYGEKSIKPDDSYTDYVYDICGSKKTAGRSQIMIKKTTYDQSNWVKLVVSPNYDGRHEVVAPENRPDLSQYVDHIIPAGTLDVFMTDTVNPEAHVLAIQMGDAMKYEPNVYISGHFNDTVVFNYTHTDWQPGEYLGNFRTEPFINWTFNEEGEVTGGTASRRRVEDDPYYMFYVAPKPQEVAYITWVVYDNKNLDDAWPSYSKHEDYDSWYYVPTTGASGKTTPPSDPGRFYGPMNWNRKTQIPGEAYENLEYLAGDELDKALGAWDPDYGPYSNGYMQYGAIKINWSLFQEETPWWQIFKPGQAYKFKAIIRYARGSGYNPDPESGDKDDTADNYYYGPSSGYFIDGDDNAHSDGGTVFNAPRRDDVDLTGYANMYFCGDYRDADLKRSKFIIFPIQASAMRSDGDGMGNVTSVDEVISNVNASRTVAGVRYYNLMGVESDKPFDGINIVVTTYSDGSRTSKKVLR